MIQAFKDVGLAEYSDIAAYFEMTRAAKTNQIIAIKRDLETLEYALEQERPIRG
ncbi:hypothetical protein [Gloeothece verrucosa]|uniref:hypothetical protein n=1 Tax=Gloeothece verrucosa TaxID=2546359 RepID=UPI00017E1F21|nr:hypothetical protein [Gloeothece verrucosa]